MLPSSDLMTDVSPGIMNMMDATSWPRWIAHRGAGKEAPENTLAAFRLGAEHGFRAFECDVKLSADDVPFLLHDDTLDRTTSGHGPAGAMRWHDLSMLDAGGWLGPAWAGEPPASLAGLRRFLAAQPERRINLELKPCPGLGFHTGQVVARTVAQHWRPHQPWPLFSSFDPAALEGARSAAPDGPRARLLDTLHSGWLQEAQTLGCCAVVLNHHLVDAQQIALIQAAKLQTWVYTVNDVERARALFALGVHSVITDRLDLPAQLGLATDAV